MNPVALTFSFILVVCLVSVQAIVPRNANSFEKEVYGVSRSDDVINMTNEVNGNENGRFFSTHATDIKAFK